MLALPTTAMRGRLGMVFFQRPPENAESICPPRLCQRRPCGADTADRVPAAPEKLAGHNIWAPSSGDSRVDFCYSCVPRRLHPMPRNVRCALIQASNALSTERPLAQIQKAMIDKHLKLIEQAARKKAQILCLQELFYGPYFCAEQNARWYELTERVPDGPTVRLM